MPTTLHDLTLSDYDEILALWHRAGLSVRPEGRDAPEAVARQMAMGTQRLIGLRLAVPGDEPGSLVAVAVLTHDGRKGWINRLAVDPAHRRRGLAQALIAESERWFAEDLGLEVFAALIHHDNLPSLSLFRSQGYGEADVVYVARRLRPTA